MVELVTVNHSVGGSSPSLGAKLLPYINWLKLRLTLRYVGSNPTGNNINAERCRGSHTMPRQQF